ncbi:MAG: SRPBCC family protein [Deltaproteobacteria bacterium]|nr:SRPBCC family protein [Deltaproteobacteria bacterium]
MASRAVRPLTLFVLFFLTGFTKLSAQSSTIEPSEKQLSTGEPFIYRIAPDARGGEAYKLVYLVPVPIEVLWRFKTDFHGDFVETNKYIKNQRVIQEEQNVVVIENRLANKPETKFRWRNVLFPKKYRLDFILENPEQCGQRFHYGHFQLEPLGSYTKVSHEAYFDFFGASLWAYYPWEGGMYAFLDYIARWEQETILKVKDDYE